MALLSSSTADGYALRVDLRLRPDAGATQVALSTDAAMIYYESFGQNWERAALIKAHPHLGRIDQVAANDWQALPVTLPAKATFRNAIKDFYLTNPIARASETMQRCSAELLHGEEFAEAAE